MGLLAGGAELSAVGGLYRDHHHWLHTWLRRKLGCSEHAADIAQDVFVRLLRRDHNVALGEPRAYLTVIARGLVIEHWRRRDLERAWLEMLAELPEALGPSPEERLVYLEALMALDRILDGLKPKVRQALVLARIDGLSCPKIAQHMGVSLATAERYLAAALKHCYALQFEYR